MHFVLVDTTHAGNIGAAARAMKTMGFHSLRLVNPCRFLIDEVFARASGADDVVHQATVYDSLAAAVADCARVFGTSARARSLDWTQVSAREAAALVGENARLPLTRQAVVFGRERSGLTNLELELCTHRLWIPTDSEFGSLNLGAAVQVVAYELRQALMSSEVASTERGAESPDQVWQAADTASMERFFEHLERTLVLTGFLNPDNPRLLMRRLRRYFNRNRPDPTELNVLRGVLTAVERTTR